MIREASITDEGRLLQIINDTVAQKPDYYEGTINLGDRPFDKEVLYKDFKASEDEQVYIKIFVYEHEGIIVGYLKARFQPNMRCSIDIISVDQSYSVRQRTKWIVELLHHLCNYSIPKGITYLQGRIIKRNKGIMDLFSRYGSYAEDRKEADSDWGGYVYIEKDVFEGKKICEEYLSVLS